MTTTVCGRAAAAVLLCALLLPLFVHGNPTKQFHICDAANQRHMIEAASQTQLIYNEVRNEYFAVFIHEEVTGKTSVTGQRFSSHGFLLGPPVHIFPYRSSAVHSYTKRMPVVAHNTNTDVYLVAWEFDVNGDGTDWDVVGNLVHGNGSVFGDPFFLVASSVNEDSPHLAFSPQDNSYVLACAVRHPTNESAQGISVQRLNETHYIGEAVVLSTDNADREPFVAHHPPTNNFLLVWEFDVNSDNKSEIGAVTVGGMPLKASSTEPTLVGSTTEVLNGHTTFAHDHGASLVYSSRTDAFLLLWEVDGDSGEKEVVCDLVTPSARPTGVFQALGNASHPHDARPSAVYSAEADQFFVVFESGPAHMETGIEGVALSSRTLNPMEKPFTVSRNPNGRDHSPVVAHSTDCHNVLTLWGVDNTHLHRSARSSGSSNRSGRQAQARFEAAAPAMGQPSGASLQLLLPNKFARLRRAVQHGVDDPALMALPHVPLAAAIGQRQQQEEAASYAGRRSDIDLSVGALSGQLVCLPGRSVCGDAPARSPVVRPSPSAAATPSTTTNKDGGGNGSSLGLVLGMLSALALLTVLGMGGFLAWRRAAEIRQWWEDRQRRGDSIFLGSGGGRGGSSWADESEFSIPIDTFSTRGVDDDDMRGL